MNRGHRLDKKYVYFDCDDTLVMWGRHQSPKCVAFKDPYNKGEKILLVPHENHIQKLISYSGNGWVVVVWSRGGYPWAREVVRGLGLQGYVDHILAKPDIYFDDVKCCDFMDCRSYNNLVENPDAGE